MRRTARAWAVGCAAGTLGLAPARAQSLDVEGYLDLRVADAGDETSWLDGGLGKARFGAGDDAWSGGGALTAHFQATPALLATATVQYQPEPSSSTSGWTGRSPHPHLELQRGLCSSEFLRHPPGHTRLVPDASRLQPPGWAQPKR